ncbi:MAG TPA: helix-turn-helix domain-containing protein [Microbacteriaceae bacterium]|nr:helix-turn-helix domain-containing protein [Microbacteriaceae bacterium]
MENDQTPESRRTAADRRHSVTRERLLRALESGGSARITDLVASTGLHENTIRGHLHRLQADGHVRREPQPPTGRGRPATHWHAVDPHTTNPYAGLAATLADTLTSTVADAPRAAHAAGEAWGERLAEEHLDAAGARALVIDIMREQGFAPGDDGEDDGVIALRRCPLLAAATRHPDVICSVHEGMIDGIIRAHGEDATVELEPFAADGTCRLRVRAAS